MRLSPLFLAACASAPGQVAPVCPAVPVSRPAEIAAMAEQVEARNLTLDLGGEGEHQIRLLVSMLEEYRAITARCQERR